MPLNVSLRIVVPSLQDSMPFGLDVLKLTPVNGPAQQSQDGQHEQDGDGDQDVEDFHWVAPRRRELRTTPRELNAMPSPAAQGGSRPMSARGMQAKL